MTRLIPFSFLTIAVGCGGASGPASPSGSTPEPAAPSDGHSHERGKMMIADFGPYHALLTAHLSKDGHKLDLFVETPDDLPKPIALSVEVLKASVQVRRADGGVREIEFKPAPADARPSGEAAGTCSHFVAKAPWLETDTEYRIIVEVELNGKSLKGRWNNFVPRKYAHHED